VFQGEKGGKCVKLGAWVCFSACACS